MSHKYISEFFSIYSTGQKYCKYQYAYISFQHFLI